MRPSQKVVKTRPKSTPIDLENVVVPTVCPYCRQACEEGTLASLVYPGRLVHLECYFKYEDPQ